MWRGNFSILVTFLPGVLLVDKDGRNDRGRINNDLGKSDVSRATQLASLVSAICLCAGALADPAGAPPIQLNIAAQPIDDALREFGRQSGLQVFLASVEGEGVTASAVNGTYTATEALRKLLSNTGLRYEYIDERTIAIRPIAQRSESWQKTSNRSGGSTGTEQFSEAARNGGKVEDAATIETVNVFATLDNPLSVGSKSGGTLRETPKSVSIMTGERIEAQNLASLQEVLIQSTGVTVGAFNPIETFYYSRGIRLETLQFDGGAPAYTGGLGFQYTPDTATIERVEILRGVDGMYSGAGEPGGVINLVRKRPGAAPALQVNLSAGTWDNYRAIVDGTAPLALDGRLRGRAVVSYMDRGYHLENYTTEKKILFGTLEFDATDSTLLALGVSYEKRDDEGFPGWGTARFSDGRTLGLPREFSVAPDWSHWNFETQEVFARVEQRYGDTGVLRLNVNQIEQESEMDYLNVYGEVNPVTLAGSRIYNARSDYSPIQRMADLSASGKLQLFGKTHSYTIGMDYTMLDSTELSYTMPGFMFVDAVPVNYFDYDPANFPRPAGVANYFYPFRERSQRGFYATVGVQLAEPLRLTLGGRYGKFRYDEALTIVESGETSYLRYKEAQFIPSAALSYTLSEHWTVYLSYGETFKAQSDLLQAPPPGGDPLDPIVGNNLELGIKGDVFQGVTAAASVYRLKRDGQGVVDPRYAGVSNPETGSRCCYVQQGEITVEGLDLEMSGTVRPGWQVFGGYTFTQTDYVGNPTGATALGRTPKHQLKAWSTYRLPGRLSAFTLNSGVVAQSEAKFRGFSYGGITLWNASVQYEWSERWTLALYGDNLTDKVYWQPTGTLDSQNIYGTPRSITASLHARF